MLENQTTSATCVSVSASKLENQTTVQDESHLLDEDPHTICVAAFSVRLQQKVFSTQGLETTAFAVRGNLSNDF